MRTGILQRQRIIEQVTRDMRREEEDMRQLADACGVPDELTKQHEQDQLHRQAVIDKHVAAIESARAANRARDSRRRTVKAAGAEGTRLLLAEQAEQTRARKEASRLRSRISRYLVLSVDSGNPLYYDWRIRQAREQLAELTKRWGKQVLGEDD